MRFYLLAFESSNPFTILVLAWAENYEEAFLAIDPKVRETWGPHLTLHPPWEGIRERASALFWGDEPDFTEPGYVYKVLSEVKMTPIE